MPQHKPTSYKSRHAVKYALYGMRSTADEINGRSAAPEKF